MLEKAMAFTYTHINNLFIPFFPKLEFKSADD